MHIEGGVAVGSQFDVQVAVCPSSTVPFGSYLSSLWTPAKQ